jgi:hypothetical protein
LSPPAVCECCHGCRAQTQCPLRVKSRPHTVTARSALLPPSGHARALPARGGRYGCGVRRKKRSTSLAASGPRGSV